MTSGPNAEQEVLRRASSLCLSGKKYWRAPAPIRVGYAEGELSNPWTLVLAKMPTIADIRRLIWFCVSQAKQVVLALEPFGVPTAIG